MASARGIAIGCAGRLHSLTENKVDRVLSVWYEFLDCGVSAVPRCIFCFFDDNVDPFEGVGEKKFLGLGPTTACAEALLINVSDRRGCSSHCEGRDSVT